MNKNMIGTRVNDKKHGLGTIVAETDIKYMIEYDNAPGEYIIYDKEAATK